MSPSINQSCPSGLTKTDLKNLFSAAALTDFNRWMNGQTMSICDGKRFHYLRAHNDFCMVPHGAWTNHAPEPAHKEGDEFTWACDYLPGGWYEATACSGLPEGTIVDKDVSLTGHGIVAYRWDVERFIEGKLAKAVWD